MNKPNILTLEIAEKLLKDDQSLDIAKFTTLEDAAAKVLAKYEGTLWLSEIKSVSDAAAAALSEHKGSLILDGITTLSKAAASSLAKVAPLPGDHNSLNFRSLLPTIEVVKQLAKYQGDQITFGMTSIDLPFAKAMAPFQGQLWIGNVSQLDDDVVRELAKRSGGAYLKGVRDPSIKKQMVTLKRKQAIAAIKEGKLKEPEEWQNGRIVLSKPPLKPLKGQNSARTAAGDSSWWLPKTVCKWFEEKLDELHKAKFYEEGTKISPEAAELLRSKSTEWFWLFEKEKSAEKERARMKLESLATVKAPQEFQGGRVVLPLPKKPLEEVYQWKPDFEVEDYAAVLNFYDYLPEEHLGSVVDSSGYPAKITTPEAADLYRKHRAFWEGKHAEAMAKARAAAATRKKTAKENFDKAAASAGLSREELDAKLNRLGELVEQENLKLAADMIAGFGDAWLYEALLAGASVTADGDLKHGKVLKRFKSEAELIMALTMAYMPKGAKVDLSIRTDTPIHMKVTADNIDVVAEMIAPHFPDLKASLEGMGSLKKLHEMTAEFLVKNEKDLHLFEINTIRLKEAMILSKFEGDLILDGLKQIDADVANALSQIKGKLSLEGISSVSETEAMELSRHMGGLALGIKDLTAPIAKALAATRGTLELTGLATISPEAAAALETHSGKLSFGKYDYFFSGKAFDLSVDSARHLARHNGPIIIRELKRINADAALALSELKHDLALESIEEFPDGVAGVKLCTKMVNSSPGDFRLDLVRLQPDCASVLAACRGDLWLSVDEWNDDALLALASYQGRLEINPKQISDAVGLALGQRSAQSSLLIKYTSVTLSDGAAEALGNYLGHLSFDEGIELSKEAATHLVKRSRMSVYCSKMKPAIRKIFDAAGSWSGTIWTRNP
jgi:hypothetical protein